jgi:CRISPR type III-A-associated protein Csm2
MANNNYGNYGSQKNQGGSKQNRLQKPKKTFSELGEDVKLQFFKENFTELLNMSKTAQLDKILESIENFVSVEGKNLSTSQLRNIYDKANKATSVNELKLIRPNLAYLAGRSSRDEEKSLLAFIDLLIKEVKSDNGVKEFHVFFESVVAYHKFYGKQ